MHVTCDFTVDRVEDTCLHEIILNTPNNSVANLSVDINPLIV